jgi:hypothetical protein
MLTAEDILKYKKKTPFARFRITTVVGERYDVSDPAHIMVGRRDIVVGIACKIDPSICDRSFRISIPDVATITELPHHSQTEFYPGYA